MHAIPSLMITAIKWQALLANNKSKMQAIIDNMVIIIITMISLSIFRQHFFMISNDQPYMVYQLNMVEND